MLLNEMSARVHEANKKWWVDINTADPIERNVGEMFALMHSELGEMTEAIRKGLIDDHLRQYPGEQVELVDMVIRLLDFLGGTGVDMGDRIWGVRWSTRGLSDNKLERVADMHKSISALYVEADRMVLDNDAIASNADALFRKVIAYAEDFGFLPVLYDIYEAKMQYNAERADHKLSERRKPGGKKV